MACITRILRLLPLRTPQCSLVRNLTSQCGQVRAAPLPLLFTQNPWIWQKNDKIDSPIIKQVTVDLPNGLKWVPPIEDPQHGQQLHLPPLIGNDAKEAARLIVIRRRKMKRHKLKKLRKRMKYEWAKRRQGRELKKERAFQAVLIKQCKEAEAFSAEKYVEERLAKYMEVLKVQTPPPKN